MEAIEAGKDIDRLMIRKDLNGDLARELLTLARTYEIPVQRVPQEKLNRITMKNHQGAIAMLSAVTYHKLDQILPSLYEEGETPLILVLDGLTDTRNFGAIARTAECAGVHAIVIPDRGSVSVTADAVKTSAGALLHIPVCREQNLQAAVKFMKDNGLMVAGASEKSDSDYTDIDFTVPAAIVMGAEDTGISAPVLKLCDRIATIPLAGHIGSLNVSVATGIITFEAVRQRRLAAI